jgi:hypothetical protein
VSGIGCMLLGTILPSILPDFDAASDRSHCDFVCCAARRGKMIDVPRACASALENKTAFQALFPEVSRLAERVFRGQHASWHVEFIGKLVSVDQANLDAAGGHASLADKAFVWLAKAKRGELVMPSADEHSSCMVLAATAVSGGEQAVEEKTVRVREEGGKCMSQAKHGDETGEKVAAQYVLLAHAFQTVVEEAAKSRRQSEEASANFKNKDIEVKALFSRHSMP